MTAVLYMSRQLLPLLNNQQIGDYSTKEYLTDESGMARPP